MDDGAARLEREFNGYGEVENQTLTVNGKAVGEVALTRDDVGRIIAKTEVIDGVTFEYQYEYDDFGRLTVVRDGTGSELERYTYGPQGERLTETNVLRGIVSRSFTYDDEDRLLTAGGAEYEFDADGFLTSKTEGSETTTYDYSSRGELKKVELPDGRVVEYSHDPLGRRVAKIVDGEVIEKYLWLGRTRLLAVYNGDGSLKWRFLYAYGTVPIGMVQDGKTYYFAYDQVGSLRVVTDATGAVVKTVRYDAFGNIIEDSNPDLDVPFGFAGGLHDRDTGLVRFGFRDYDPNTGRWTSKDPIEFKNSNETDLFGYCMDDPINQVDSNGLWATLLDLMPCPLQTPFTLNQSTRELRREMEKRYKECINKPHYAPKGCYEEHVENYNCQKILDSAYGDDVSWWENLTHKSPESAADDRIRDMEFEKTFGMGQ